MVTSYAAQAKTQPADRPPDAARGFRFAAYALLAILALSAASARIMNVRSADGRTPFLSANDRSRWATVRALVDYGTYAIDAVIRHRGWDTIDKVRHVGRDGQPHYYSSKPPLFPTLMAGEYWLIRNITGASFQRRPFYVGRLMLIVTNVVPLAIYFAVLIGLVERLGGNAGRTLAGSSDDGGTAAAGPSGVGPHGLNWPGAAQPAADPDWSRLFTCAAATFGTFLTTFAITINNHLPAAVGIVLAVAALVRIVREDCRAAGTGWFVLAGLAGGWAAANELPALAWLALSGGVLAWIDWRRTLAGFVPAALLVAAAFFLTNYAAHASWKPPYMHRSEGDNWYGYEGSYWLEGVRKGIDEGEPSRAIYAMNVLVGHHGIFSLTPIWLLSVVGTAMSLRARPRHWRVLGWSTALLTVVCLLFYLSRPLIDRNYGGMTCGFRWLFWLIPLWLVMLIPAVTSLSRWRLGRWVAYAMLAVSVFSAHFAAMNPWQHPWIYRYWQFIGWLPA